MQVKANLFFSRKAIHPQGRWRSCKGMKGLCLSKGKACQRPSQLCSWVVTLTLCFPLSFSISNLKQKASCRESFSMLVSGSCGQPVTRAKGVWPAWDGNRDPLIRALDEYLHGEAERNGGRREGEIKVREEAAVEECSKAWQKKRGTRRDRRAWKGNKKNKNTNTHTRSGGRDAGWVAQRKGQRKKEKLGGGRIAQQ